MKKEDFESLRRGMAEADAFLAGEREGFVVHEPVDVRAVRARTELKRRDFAERYNLDARAVEQWEQGRRRPERGTEMYLRLIGHDPERVAQMVSQMVREEPERYRPQQTGAPSRRGKA
jgi:putative transcriptional regulator